MTEKIRKTTDVHFAEELDSRNPYKYKQLIMDAQKGMFHDFKSSLATPKMELAKRLLEYPELNDLREGIISGEFDEPITL